MKRALLLTLLSTTLCLNVTPAKALNKVQTGVILIGGALACAVACDFYAGIKSKLEKIRNFCREKPHWPIAAAVSAVGLCLICQNGVDSIRSLYQ